MKTVSDMTEEEKAQTRAWIKNWQELGPILDDLRREELRNLAETTSLAPFNSFFRAAIRETPPEPTSGLIEQQALFAKGRS